MRPVMSVLYVLEIIAYVLSAAIKRYFESQKRMHRESKPEQRARVNLQEKKRKARSRRQRVSIMLLQQAFC